MKYSMEATIEAVRLEEQVFESNYSLSKELGSFKFSPDEYILDAGCGTGVLSRYLVKNFGIKKIDAIDASDLRLHQARQLCDNSTKSSIHFFQQDLDHLDIELQNRYDTVICRYVLEHVKNPIEVLLGLKKTLKKGGRIIIVDLDGVFINLHSENKKLNEYMKEIKSRVPFDLEIGRKLPGHLANAGFSNVQWSAELLCCKGQSLEEETRNTGKRFVAIGAFLTDLLGSENSYMEFKKLYLEEMLKSQNTLVFNKYICTGIKND